MPSSVLGSIKSAYNRTKATLYNFKKRKRKRSKKPKNQIQKSILQEVNRIESGLWHRKAINFCKKKIRQILHPQPKINIRKLMSDLSENTPNNQQKQIAAVKLHCGKSMKVFQSEDGKLNFKDLKIAISTEKLEQIINSSSRDGIVLAYEYLEKGMSLPEGFLKSILLPDIYKNIDSAIEYGKNHGAQQTQNQKEGLVKYQSNRIGYIQQLLEKCGIKDEKSFNFGRMIEFKKELRNNITLTIEEQELKPSSPKKQTEIPEPVHNLTKPKSTDHFIDKADRHHITTLASKKSFFSKANLKDMANKVKRVFLRNKINHLFLIGGLIAGIIISAAFPPAGLSIGIGIAIGFAVDVAYDIFWASGSGLFTRMRLLLGLKKIKKYADFDHTDLSSDTTKKRSELIKHLMYQCKHKTFSQIYNSYAELEKQGEKIEKLQAKTDNSTEHSILLEKERGIYRRRLEKIKSDFYFFDKLIEQVIINRIVIERRNQENIRLLISEKFENMNSTTRDTLFKKASKELVIGGHKLKFKRQTTFDRIFRRKPKSLPNQSNVEKTSTDTNSDRKASDVSKVKKKKTELITDPIKSLAQIFAFRVVRKTVFNNLLALTKIVSSRDKLTIYNPVTVMPNLTASGFVIAFFCLEMVSSRLNQKQNQSRYDDIINNRKGYTRQLFGKRLRTGREEVSTLRVMAKNQIEPMLDHMLKSTKSMEEIQATLEDAKKRSKLLGKNNFDSLSNEDAAKLVIEHVAWQQLLDNEINGAIGHFHHMAQNKILQWNKKVVSDFSSKN